MISYSFPSESLSDEKTVLNQMNQESTEETDELQGFVVDSKLKADNPDVRGNDSKSEEFGGLADSSGTPEDL